LDDFLPLCHLQVSYSSHREEVKLGNTIKPSHTKKAPTIRITCPDTGVYSNDFTIALTDPDAPSRKDPKWSEMCHWIATVLSNSTASFDEIHMDSKHENLNDLIECKTPLTFPSVSAKLD
jgi:phosphatidylethanolamine-binding protein (PEBP) family uncharacterized protein